jgi:hypothetical protein
MKIEITNLKDGHTHMVGVTSSRGLKDVTFAIGTDDMAKLARALDHASMLACCEDDDVVIIGPE